MVEGHRISTLIQKCILEDLYNVSNLGVPHNQIVKDQFFSRVFDHPSSYSTGF